MKETLEEKFANRLQEQVDKGGFAGRACQEKEGETKGGREGGEQNLCLCGQMTQKLERHRLIKMHSAPHPPLASQLPLGLTPLCFFPSSSLSPSLCSAKQAKEGHGPLMFWVVVQGFPEVTAAIFF